jgi:hypothetical protein
VAQTYTVADIERRMSERINDYHAFTTTAAGNTGGTYLTCSTLRERPGDGWVPYFVVPSSGAASGEIRPSAKYEPVDDDVSDLSNLYLQTPFSAQIASAVTFRLHRFHPTSKLQAIDETLRNPRFLRNIPNVVSEDIPSGSLLRNGNFEYWITTARPHDWEVIAGAPARSTTAYEERYSVSLPNSADIRQRIRLPYETDQETLIFTGRANGSGFTARIAVTEDGATTNTDTVLGAGWNTVTATFMITDPMRPVYIDLISSGGTILWDNCRLMLPLDSTTGATIQEFVDFIPASEMYVNGFSRVEVGYFEQASVATDAGFGIKDTVIDYKNFGLPEYYDRGYGFYKRPTYGGSKGSTRLSRNQDWYPGIPVGHWLRITGEGKYSVVSATMDSVELPSDEALDYLAILSAQRLYQKGVYGEIVGETARWDANVQKLEAEAQAMERDGIAIPRPRIAHGIFR